LAPVGIHRLRIDIIKCNLRFNVMISRKRSDVDLYYFISGSHALVFHLLPHQATLQHSLSSVKTLFFQDRIYLHTIVYY